MDRAPTDPPVPVPYDRHSPENARRASRGRWGAPRRVRMDALTDAQRWAVYNLVASMTPAPGKGEGGER